ncbi:MAG: 3-hydroxyacyl-CoA dehydrogenase family protein [Dehalococcoidia bacterium]|nr:MAG: 3-hydroxyacyl-CoA dehydrogenase family protein [Dehalococcoidia bacterium]
MQLEDIRNISVIGAGIMGHGIGLTYALGGYRVVLNDTREEILTNAISHIRNELKTFAESGLISQDMIEKTLSRLTTTTDLKEAVKDADFVTEAAIEDVGVKRKIFTDLDIFCPEHSILTSNTSSLVLRDFTSQCKRRDKILITHWFNPPHIVPVVEVVRGEETSDETMELVYALLKKVKKLPVKILKEIPGFVVNRIQTGMFREVWSLWQQGIASPEDIDLAVKGSFGFRLAAIGPLETCDLGGLDLWYGIADRLFKVIDDAHQPSEALKKKVEAGELGLKSGKGFFDYSVDYFTKGQDERVKTRDNKFIQLLKLLYSQ